LRDFSSFFVRLNRLPDFSNYLHTKSDNPPNVLSNIPDHALPVQQQAYKEL